MPRGVLTHLPFYHLHNNNNNKNRVNTCCLPASSLLMFDRRWTTAVTFLIAFTFFHDTPPTHNFGIDPIVKLQSRYLYSYLISSERTDVGQIKLQTLHVTSPYLTISSIAFRPPPVIRFGLLNLWPNNASISVPQLYYWSFERAVRINPTLYLFPYSYT